MKPACRRAQALLQAERKNLGRIGEEPVCHAAPAICTTDAARGYEELCSALVRPPGLSIDGRHERRWLNRQRVGESADDTQRGRFDPPFQLADVGTVNARASRQFFLRVPTGISHALDLCSESKFCLAHWTIVGSQVLLCQRR